MPHHVECEPCLRGVIAPMLTPVNADHSLDLAGAREMCRWLASTGAVSAVFVRSGMGRMHTFTMEEARVLAATARDALPPGVHVVGGASGEWLGRERGERPDAGRYTAQAIELTNAYERMGLSAAVHILPEAIAAGAENAEERILAYFRSVHDATRIPIVLYQPAGLPPECRLTERLLERLLDLPRIAGLKLSTTDDEVYGPIAQMVRGRPFGLICGHEGYYRRGLAQGAVGVIGQGCNGYPEVLQAVQRAHAAGDDDLAARAEADTWRGLEITRGVDHTVALKQVLQRKGYAVQPYDRSGGALLSETEVDRIERALDRLREPYMAGRSAVERA